MTDDLMAELSEGTLIRVTIPLSDGSRKTVDGAVEATRELTICVQDEQSSPLELAEKGPWVFTRDLSDSVLLYRAHLTRRLADRRFILAVDSVVHHAATRKSCRVEAIVRIREWAGKSAWSRLRKANTRQVTLSTSGIRFVTGETLSPGQRLSLEITLPGPGQTTIQTEGDVIRSRPVDLSHREVAVAFTGMNQEKIDVIETFFITSHFKVMHDRVKLLGEVLSPTLDHPDERNPDEHP